MIGPYKVLELLGRGGFGTVFLAEQTAPVRREVAVKVLNPGMDVAELRARFEVERETLNLMKHPGIAMLLDAGVTEEDQPYFVMEYVPGTPLHEYIEKHRLSLRERLVLFRHVCDAVQHAHNKGIIHRDLTASNVLITDLDGEPSPKIIDFGIAKSMGATLVDLTLHTSEGQAMGTPAYMSPEQALGEIAKIDTRTDIYALGVQLYLLLTGTLPFTEEHLRSAGVGILQMICETDPERPSKRMFKVAEASTRRTLTHELRGDLDWITAKAMAKEREHRYASVAELGEDVRRFMEYEPVLAGPPTTWYRLRKGLRRYRGAVTAAALILLSLIVGLVVSIRLYYRSAASEAEAQQNLDRFNYLADVVEFETLREEVADLGPARPENRAAMEAWLARSEGLLGRLDELRAVVAEGGKEAEDPADRRAQDFLHRELSGLLAELEQFAEAPNSALANVRARLAWAVEVEAKTIEAHRAAWAEAAERVAADGRFGDLVLVPQMGLVPLGPDRESELEEFVVLRSGDALERDPESGKLLMSGEEGGGIVLVLVPGGTFDLGALKDESSHQHDPDARENESWAAVDADGQVVRRLVPVTLAPFLISKYEVTQAQWARMSMGEWPSELSKPVYKQYGVGPLHPVENVSWERGREVLAEYGLELPTEAQWEYACRAGTHGVWFAGSNADSLAGYANVSDVSARGWRMPWGGFEGVVIDDGYPYTARVGWYLPNAFGLHDMHGNVFEWCLDPFGPYDPELISGPQARRLLPATDDDPSSWNYVMRGGGYRYREVFARCSYRWYAPAETAIADVGVRPVRVLEY